MLIFRRLVRIGLGVVLAWAVSDAVRAETVPQLAPIGVFDLGEIETWAKTPVISRVALAPTGPQMATCGDDHLVRIWDADQGTVVGQLDSHGDWVRCVAFSPDGRFLATAGDDRRIRLWDAAGRQPVASISSSEQAIHTLAFSPDGRRLAAAGFGDKIFLIDTDAPREPRVLDAPGGDIRALTYSPDGQCLAGAGRQGVIRLWDLGAEPPQARDLTGHERRVWALAYSPDGKQLASGGDERNVWLWDTDTASPTTMLPTRPAKVFALAFCPDDRLAVGGTDNVIRVWDLASSQEVFELVGHTGSVTSLVWDARSAILVSGGFDTTVRRWRLYGEQPDRVSRQSEINVRAK